MLRAGAQESLQTPPTLVLGSARACGAAIEKALDPVAAGSNSLQASSNKLAAATLAVNVLENLFEGAGPWLRVS